jgi:multidrug efflux pump subunit AcrA (membrane-fusion protein)
VKSLFLFLVPLFVLAKVHYAKVEPYESVVLKAAVSGTVVDVDLGAEGTVVSGKRIVHVDDTLERIDLNTTKQSLSLLEQTLAIDEEMAALLEKNTIRQKGYYERIEKLSTASKTQKDTAYAAYVSVKNQYLATKEKIAGLKRQMLDLRYKLARLKDTIAKKNSVLEGRYLYRLMVRKGDFVAPGTPIARIDNIQKAKLVLFLNPEELDGVEKKTVYLDDKKTAYRVNKVWRIADEKYISSYRAEIYILAPKTRFSKLVKVEIK